MTDTLKKLFSTAACTATLITAYTTPALTKTIVREVFICNPTAGSVTFLLKLGGVTVVPTKSIPAGDTLFLDLYTILEAGDTISLQAGTASSLEVRISGMEVA